MEGENATREYEVCAACFVAGGGERYDKLPPDEVRFRVRDDGEGDTRLCVYTLKKELSRHCLTALRGEERNVHFFSWDSRGLFGVDQAQTSRRTQKAQARAKKEQDKADQRSARQARRAEAQRQREEQMRNWVALRQKSKKEAEEKKRNENEEKVEKHDEVKPKPLKCKPAEKRQREDERRTRTRSGFQMETAAVDELWQGTMERNHIKGSKRNKTATTANEQQGEVLRKEVKRMTVEWTKLTDRENKAHERSRTLAKSNPLPAINRKHNERMKILAREGLEGMLRRFNAPTGKRSAGTDASSKTLGDLIASSFRQRVAVRESQQQDQEEIREVIGELMVQVCLQTLPWAVEDLTRYVLNDKDLGGYVKESLAAMAKK